MSRCPHCDRDIRDQVVLSWAGDIIAHRRRRAGHQVTPERARAMQLASAAARVRNAAERAAAGKRP